MITQFLDILASQNIYVAHFIAVFALPQWAEVNLQYIQSAPVMISLILDLILKIQASRGQMILILKGSLVTLHSVNVN